jgi:hypothetical protein
MNFLETIIDIMLTNEIFKKLKFLLLKSTKSANLKLEKKELMTSLTPYD